MQHICHSLAVLQDWELPKRSGDASFMCILCTAWATLVTVWERPSGCVVVEKALCDLLRALWQDQDVAVFPTARHSHGGTDRLKCLVLIGVLRALCLPHPEHVDASFLIPGGTWRKRAPGSSTALGGGLKNTRVGGRGIQAKARCSQNEQWCKKWWLETVNGFLGWKAHLAFLLYPFFFFFFSLLYSCYSSRSMKPSVVVVWRDILIFRKKELSSFYPEFE